MIVSAWIMGLIISTPMYIDAPGFSNFTREINYTGEIYNTTNGTIQIVNCMPPVSIFFCNCRAPGLGLDFDQGPYPSYVDDSLGVGGFLRICSLCWNISFYNTIYYTWGLAIFHTLLLTNEAKT